MIFSLPRILAWTLLQTEDTCHDDEICEEICTEPYFKCCKFKKHSFVVVLHNICSGNLAQFRTTRSPWGLQLYYKETPTQLFSCKYCDIFNSIFFTEHLQWLLLSMNRKIPLMESLLLLACDISKKQNFFTWVFSLPLHDCFQMPSVLHISETYFGPCQRSMMELFSKIGND